MASHVNSCGMQHWLKVMHSFRGERQATVGDPHRLGVDGEPTMRPAYEPGDLAVIYLAGTYRCPAIVEFTGEPAFEAAERALGLANAGAPGGTAADRRSTLARGHRRAPHIGGPPEPVAAEAGAVRGGATTTESSEVSARTPDSGPGPASPPPRLPPPSHYAPRAMPLHCVYTDLDGTLLGPGGSLFRAADGGFTLLAARGLEACARAGAEVVLMSGRGRQTVAGDARLLGQTAFVYELGGGLSIDGEDTLLTGELQPEDGVSVHDLIERSGAPRLLLERFAGRLEYHEPWHRGRAITHLLRGLVDAREADALLAEHGLAHLRLVDNGTVSPKPSLPGLPGPPHAYHLLPRETSKGAAVARHMAARGYAPEETIAVGDSAEDLGVAAVTGRFFLVANARVEPDAPNAVMTEASHGEGFYEAVVRTLAEGAG